MDFSSDSEKQIKSYLESLENRISRIENVLNIDSSSADENFHLPPIIPQNISEEADSLETQIGQFWFAKVGIVILALGIIFLMTFPYQNLPSAIPSIVGFLLVGGLVSLSRYWKNTLPFLSQYIFGGGLLLLYFSTLRLHFFSPNPVIGNMIVEFILLLVISCTHLIISYKRESIYLSAIAITLISATALLSNNSTAVFLLLTLLSAVTVFLKKKFGWTKFFTYATMLIYLAHFIWFIGNPIAGNKIELQSSPYINGFFLLLYMIIFAIGNLSYQRGEKESVGAVVNTFLNSFLCFLLILIISLTKFRNLLALSEFITSIVFLVLSIVFYEKQKGKYATFLYSILGYTALSVAIVGNFPEPDFFVWLCWQSLVVVSTAIWFRSKIIIVANFGMYIIIFFSYLILAGRIGLVALSFGVVALISARILNWQKHRLDLKTEVMRLSYLGAAFFIFPYALYHIVPKDYVGLSWTVVALGYYIISVILKNKKYRWMALLTFLITVAYTLFVGTTNLDPSYRIISFMFLGIVLLVISIFYAKRKKGSELINS